MKLSLTVGSWIRLVGLVSGFAVLPLLEAAPVPMFDGKTLVGWEGNTDIWRVENGEIVAGNPGVKLPKNDFLCTTREYGNFEMSFLYKRLGNNGGVQFRSQRVPNHHEMVGFQADFAPGIDGFLYDESRRARFLGVFDSEKGPVIPPKEGTGAAIKRAGLTATETAQKLHLAEWNRYRIRAEGARIRLWINEVLTVDYTEEDPGIPKTGLIGLQIHGGATEIRYKDLTIEELVPTEAPAKQSAGVQGAASRISDRLPDSRPSLPFADHKFTLGQDEVVVFTGSENMVLEQGQGALESRLSAQWKDVSPRFRHMSWEGDTVFRQNRMMQWGDWGTNLDAAGATVVVAWFGQVEALDSTKSVEEFSASYGALLDEFAKRTPRVVVIEIGRAHV